MTKVSKLPLRKDVLGRIFELFIETIVGIHNKKISESFIHEFFTPTERTMFAKRLAACVLLTKGQSYREISNMLRMSPVTITKLSYWVKHEGKGINLVVKQILKKQSKEILIDEIVNLFDLPHKHIHSPERLKRKTRRKQKIDKIKSSF